MKKLRLIAMFALTFALVFGAASCKNDEEEGPWGDSLAEVLKAEPKLDLSGKWKVFEGDVEFDYEDNDSEMAYYNKLYEAYLESATDEMKAEFICEEICYMKSEINSTDNEFAEELIAQEAYMKEDKENSITVLINGDRDQIRIEFELTEKDGEGKKTNTTIQTGYVTYEKK